MTFRRVLLTVATAAAPAGVPDRAQDHIAHAGADHEQHEVEHPKEDREIGGPPRNVLRKGAVDRFAVQHLLSPYLFSASLSIFPGRNRTTLEAAMVMTSPVRGLRP